MPRLQLHGKALLEEGVRVPATTAEADHGVLLDVGTENAGLGET